MKTCSRRMKLLKLLGLSLGVYFLLPLAIFDFSSVAVPYDEENHAERSVAKVNEIGEKHSSSVWIEEGS